MKTAGKKQKNHKTYFVDCADYNSNYTDIPSYLAYRFSLASSNEMFTSGLLIIPKKIQWGNYVKAFVDGHFLLYFKNSILINVLAVVIVVLVSIMTAFACRRMRWRLSGFTKTLLLMGMMIPIHATLLPN